MGSGDESIGIRGYDHQRIDYGETIKNIISRRFFLAYSSVISFSRKDRCTSPILQQKSKKTVGLTSL
jgi:hypothetical protein